MGPLVVLITECTTGRTVLLFLCGADNESSKWASNWESAKKGISSRGGTGRGGVPVWEAGLSEGARACQPTGLGEVVIAQASSPCCAAVASTSFM